VELKNGDYISKANLFPVARMRVTVGMAMPVRVKNKNSAYTKFEHTSSNLLTIAQYLCYFFLIFFSGREGQLVPCRDISSRY
jgi:hypothetical protein